MPEIEYYPTDLKKGDLPKKMQPEDIRRLRPDVYYPCQFYASMCGVSINTVLRRDYENGAIDPKEVRTSGPHRPGSTGRKSPLVVTGREIRRIFEQGRIYDRFSMEGAA